MKHVIKQIWSILLVNVSALISIPVLLICALLHLLSSIFISLKSVCVYIFGIAALNIIFTEGKALLNKDVDGFSKAGIVIIIAIAILISIFGKYLFKFLEDITYMATIYFVERFCNIIEYSNQTIYRYNNKWKNIKSYLKYIINTITQGLFKTYTFILRYSLIVIIPFAVILIIYLNAKVKADMEMNLWTYFFGDDQLPKIVNIIAIVSGAFVVFNIFRLLKEKAKDFSELLEDEYACLESESKIYSDNTYKGDNHDFKYESNRYEENNRDQTYTSDREGEEISLFNDCSNLSELTSRYHKLAKIYHPDNGIQNKEMFEYISNEYNRLKNIMIENRDTD